MELLERWASWTPQASGRFVLDGDEEVFDSPRFANRTVVHRDWPSAHRAPDFAVPGDPRLHLGLLPQPFIGDLRNAVVFVLLLNPGMGPHDYFAEFQVPHYREALLANLRQQQQPEVAPFLFLDPQFAWTGGFRWWHRKMAGLIEAWAKAKGILFGEARAMFARCLASIELVPYHSARFKMPRKAVEQLASVKAIRSFVTGVLRPRLQAGEAIAIVARKAKLWDLQGVPNVINYSGVEARGAHLTPGSAGGRQILEHLAARAGPGVP